MQNHASAHKKTRLPANVTHSPCQKNALRCSAREGIGCKIFKGRIHTRANVQELSAQRFATAERKMDSWYIR